MEKSISPCVKSPKRPSSPETATASTLSAVVNKEKQDLNIDDGDDDDDDNSVDLQLQLGKFADTPSIPKDNRLPPPKKRKTTASSLSDQRWSEDSPTLVHDGYDWRKYGQKEILNSKYPRNYFRCTRKFDQGCMATKQVQRISDDPPLYRSTYFRRHTCNQSPLSSSISHLGQATDERTQEHGMGIVFEQRSDGHTQQPSILIGFEQQPDEHTQQHSLAFNECIQQHNNTHESSSLSSSISYVAQPGCMVKHTQQPSMAHESELQTKEGVVPDVTEEPTLHVNRLCLTRPPSPTSASKKQAPPVIQDFNTPTTDLSEFGDVAHYMSEVGLSGNHGESTQKRITLPPVIAAFPVSFELAEGAKLEADRGTKFIHNNLDADADIDEFCSNAEKEFEMLSQDLKRLTLHCSLFPANYEFEKDTLVQLWIAGDFLGNVHTKDLEDSGNSFFSYLLEKKFVLPSRFDHICGDLKYKMNPAVASVLQKAYTGAEYLVVEDWKLDIISERLQHLSLVCEDLKFGIFDALKKCSRLQTLLLLSHSGFTIQEIPRNFFLRLRSLESLDLRRTNISELPDSIGNAISLRYINLSETPIRWLPESFDRLCNLQTLKLKDCLSLVGLPNGMRKLKNLRHLILDNAHKMISMPSGMGCLINLRTLSAFIVGGHYGCSIEELKNLNHLYGKLCILRLENVSNSAEAREVALSDKKNIEKLDLQWSDLLAGKREEEEEVLRQLQPHFGIKEFRILNYSGLKFPDWVSDSSFADLVSIIFFNCKNCLTLPSIGELPSLRFLCMQKMDGITEINCRFCGISQRNYAFPKLEVFKITEMPGLKEWKEVENGDFPCLNKLIIESCPELATFPLLSNFTSLKHLEVNSCPKLSFSPTEGVSPSLQALLIRDCPVLKEHWKKGEGQDWHNISQDFSLWVDHQEILI